MPLINPTNINNPAYWNNVYAAELSAGDTGRNNLNRWRAVTRLATGRGRLLDFACGTGDFCRFVHKEFPEYEVHGYDWSSVAVLHCRAMQPSGMFWTAIPSLVYDFIHCGQTLEHSSDPAAMVKTLASLRAPGGRLVVTVPYLDRVQDAEHVWQFDFEELYQMLAPYGQAAVGLVAGDDRYLLGVVL